MSLVAYCSSSDEECSDIEETNVVNQPQTSVSKKNINEDVDTSDQSTAANGNVSESSTDDYLKDTVLKLNLPQPHSIRKEASVDEEEDDEFLHKKVASSLIQKPAPRDPSRTARPAGKRQPVKISIPSLSEFDKEAPSKNNNKVVGPMPNKPSGLLNMLPPPKLGASFQKTANSNDAKLPPKPVTKTTSLIPHSVSNKLKTTEKPQTQSQPSTNKSISKPLLASNYANSDDSDSEGEDFFSLSNNEKLPEISATEINAMVAAKAAKMAEFSNRLGQSLPATSSDPQESYQEPSTSVANISEIDMQALCGTRAAKRARKEEINFIDISQAEVVPSKEEWLRGHLQGTTEYQPRGLLLDDPGAGTKKKHQITYLAYQAKANEQELQAMWAANRHTRRQTQSKYGF